MFKCCSTYLTQDSACFSQALKTLLQERNLLISYRSKYMLEHSLRTFVLIHPEVGARNRDLCKS